MNDLDLVRTLRADVHSPSPARVAAGRDRLLAATAAEPAPAAGPSRRARRPRRAFLPIGIGSIAVGAAAAIAVTVVANGAHPASPASAASSPSHPGEAPSHPGAPSRPVTAERMSLSARVLTLAANKVASESATRPADSQWVYEKLFQSQTQKGVAPQTVESWYRCDGERTASIVNGRVAIYDPGVAAVVTPVTAYNALASLPSSLPAIRAIAGDHVGTTPREWVYWSRGEAVADDAPTNQGQAEFDYLAQMLWNAYAAAPAKAEANVYRAMAGITGVTVDTHIATALGRYGIGVSANGGESWIILDPRTYQVIGLREKLTSFVKGPGTPSDPIYGTLSMVVMKAAIVDRPGER